MQVTRRTGPLLSIVLSTSLLAATAASAEERVFDKKFASAAGGTLTLNTDIGGIVITGSNGNEVVVHAVITGDHRLVEDFEVTAQVTDQGVTVTGQRPNEWNDFSWMFGPSLAVRYTIQVPRTYHVNVSNSRGDLELRDFNGRAFGHTSRGNVIVTGINGEVQIDTSRGDVHGSKLVGNVRLVTSRGDATLAQVQGPINVSSSRGNVDVQLTHPNSGAAVTTSRGDVVVWVPKEYAADLDARSSRGEVECDLTVSKRERTKSRHQQSLSGSLNGGGKLLKIETSRGDIDIRPSL